MKRHPTALRQLFHLAVPTLVAQLAVMANGLIDTVMAGRLSAVDLAAIGIGNSIFITVFVTAMGVLLALTPMVAQLYGAGETAAIGEEVRQSLWLALALSAVAIVLLRYPQPFLALARLEAPLEAKVRDYLAAMSWSVVPTMLFRVFYGFSLGVGRARPIMLFNLIGLALKLPLNWLFMYGAWQGYGGPPAMGGPGAAVATAIIAAMTCLAAWGWCLKTEEYRRYKLAARFGPPSAAAIGRLAKLGVPIGATFFVDVTGFTFMALFIARLGPVTSAAHQIAANLAALTFMLPLALGNAASVLAGHALGGGEPLAARRAGLAGIATGVAFGVGTSLVLWLAAEFIAGWYTDAGAVRELASRLIPFVALYHLFDALQVTAVNVLRGYKKAFVPMAIYACALWGVGLGGGYVLGLTDILRPAAGVYGFWSAAAASLAVAGGLVTLYFLRVAGAAARQGRREGGAPPVQGGRREA